MPGSPFRDELACAHVKIQQLESENEALRVRLDRVPPRPRPSIFVPLTTAWAILMTATVVRVSAQPMPVRATAAPVSRVPPRALAEALGEPRLPPALVVERRTPSVKPLTIPRPVPVSSPTPFQNPNLGF